MKTTYKNLPFLFLLLIILSFSTCFSQKKQIIQNLEQLSEEKVQKINRLINKYNEYGYFNGSILISKNNKIVINRGIGFANFELNNQNESDTKYRIASITKQFTAMIIMQLVAEEKIDLKTNITNYIQKLPNAFGKNINIHHLLTHTSGIPNYTSFPNYRELMSKSFKPIEILSLFSDSTLLFEPGKRFSYSNSGYVLLGIIIEEVTGMSFKKVLRERILEPLEMTNTGYNNKNSLLRNKASGYNKSINTYLESNYIDMTVAYSAGGMYSTVEDLYKWDQALYSNKLLPSKYMDLLFEEYTPAWDQYYGYGWIIGGMKIGNKNFGIETISHTGDINGFTSLILRIPSEKSTIIILSNISGAPLNKLSESICGVLFNKPYDSIKKSIAFSLYEELTTKGIDFGNSFYNNVKNSMDYFLDENEMNSVGYELIANDYINEALFVFKLSIEAFPSSFNTYDSYAEALMLSGNNLDAIENYKLSLRLNPKNEGALRKLRELGVELDQNSLYILYSEDTWRKVTSSFPLHFAKELDFIGTEEAHFPIGWRDTSSHEFWSYVIAWDIKNKSKFSKSELEDYISSYFDGLLSFINKDDNYTVKKTVTKLDKFTENGSNTAFKGVIEVFDSFITHKNLTLNVTVENTDSNQKSQCILVLRISPKNHENEIWKELEKISIRKRF